MKRVLILMVLCMVLVSPLTNVFPSKAFAQTITRIQGYAHGQTRQSAQTPVTLTYSPSSGDVLVAVVGINGNGQFSTVSSINELGVVWTRQVNQSNRNYYIDIEIWLGVVAGSGASRSIAVIASGSPFDGAVSVDVCEYSGVATNSPLDQTATNIGGWGTTTDTGTTSTTTQTNELWIGATFFYAWNQTSPRNGFSLLDGISATDVAWFYFSIAYLEKIVPETGTANTGTTTSASDNAACDWVGCIATFLAAPLSASITPLSASISIGQSLTFTSTVTGGLSPYNYQWYLNGAPVSGATSTSWTFTPNMAGSYDVCLNVTDSLGNTTQSETAGVTVTILGDIDGNGKVDVGDITIVLNAFGSYPSHPRWNPHADINSDGRIDMGDIIIVLTNFGQHYP